MTEQLTMEVMKKSKGSLAVLKFSLIISFLVLAMNVHGQDTIKVSSALPDDINKIVSFSCMPCHSSTGGMLARGKLNFTEWSGYSSEKQKEKASDIYKEVSKDKMPPKSARETRPEIILTKEQVDIIKKWVDSLQAETKKE
jgi:hypothetical protein